MKKVKSRLICFVRAHLTIMRVLKYLPLLLLLLFFLLLGIKLKIFLQSRGFSLVESISQVSQDPQKILNSTAGRSNFLILGLRGQGQDSPDLTDTLMVISYNYQDHSVKTISIPRDLWIDSLKTKINAVYHYGQQKEQNNGGMTLSQASVQQVLGIPIHYTIVINFDSFRQVIDSLGGIEVEVENEFTDDKFPIPGKENIYPIKDRYETIHFSKGWQHMDGNTALKFVRSRKSQGAEGNDFARNQRQQLVLTAIKDRIFETGIFLNKQKIEELISIVQKNVTSNIPPSSYPALVKLALANKNTQIEAITLSSEESADELAILETVRLKNYQNQWALVPKDGNGQALKDYVKNKLTGSQ